MLRSGYAALAACALAVVLSACGSDKNDPVAGDITLTVAEDTPVKISLTADNPGRDDLTATVVTPPTNGDVVFSSGSALGFTYTPHPNVNGLDAFTYQVSDGDKISNLGRVAIAIAAVNDVPTIQPTLATDEDVPVTATLIVDPDGDTFTSQIVTPPSHGTLTVDASNAGKFTYVPSADFNGTDSIELSASYIAPDTTTATVTGTVAITVRPVDDPPAAVADSVHTVQGLAARFEPLGNDRDIDRDALAVTITSGPSVGTATVNADGSIQYTPPAAFVGNTSLEYQVRDAGGLTANATMSIGVGLTSGVLYLSRADSSSPNELFFNDGARSFKVSGPVPAGDSIDRFTPAKSAPIVFYRTLDGSLYRVDLHQPGVAQQIGQAPVGEYAIDDAGSRVAYGEAGRLEFVDFAAPGEARDLGDGTLSLRMNASGSLVYYNGLTAAYAAPGALFVVETSGASPPRQITPSVAPPDTTLPVAYLSLDPATTAAAALLKQHFAGAARLGERPADDSFAIVLAEAKPGAACDIYALNLRDTTQLIPISSQIAESPALIPNF